MKNRTPVEQIVVEKNDRKILEFIDSAPIGDLIKLIRIAKYYHAAEFPKRHIEHAEWALARLEASLHVHKQTRVAWWAFAASVVALGISLYALFSDDGKVIGVDILSVPKQEEHKRTPQAPATSAPVPSAVSTPVHEDTNPAKAK
jgi:hypothetical protein